MHELALAESLVKKLVNIAETEKISEIISVTLLIGEFSGVDKEALDMALPFTAEGTFLENTDFIYECVKVKVRCGNCKKDSFPEVPAILCTHCQSDNIEIIQGREFIIKDLKI